MSQKEETSEEVTYVQPNIDFELSKEKRQVCRDMVREIKEFGISQRQLLFLIQLLAMELENREVMVAVSKACGETRSAIPAGNKILTNSEQKPPKAMSVKKIIL